MGKGLFGVFLAIGLTTWIGVCRLVRAEVVRQKAFGYVLAAQALGFSDARILFRHILPNVMHLGLVTFTLRFPASIGTEVFLSFLGIGVQDLPSWGLMISSGRLRLWQGAWWELASVTAAIFLVVLAFHLAGDRKPHFDKGPVFGGKVEGVSEVAHLPSGLFEFLDPFLVHGWFSFHFVAS